MRSTVIGLGTFATATVATAAIFAAFAACSSSETHPPTALGCGASVTCTNVGFPPGTGGVTGTDASVGDVGDAGPQTISVSGTVNTAQSFTVDPATDPVDSTESGLFVDAYQNGTLVNANVTAGTYALTDVDAKIWPTFMALGLNGRNSVTGGVGLRTLDLFRINPGTPTLPAVAIPSFDAVLVQSVNTAFSIPAATATTTGTIVLQLLDGAGVAVAGATALNPFVGDAGTGTGTGCPNSTTTTAANCGPYYDSGDAIEVGTATGARGTIVFLAVVPGNFNTTITYADGTKIGLVLPVTNQAVTFFRGALR